MSGTTMSTNGDLALVLTGGGARAAYQAGLLAGIAERFPELRFPIMTGVSAGAINAAHLAAHPGDLGAATTDLTRLWSGLTTDRIFRVDAASLGRNVLRWGTRLVSGGSAHAPNVRGLVDTAPLRTLLESVLGVSGNEPIPGIEENIRKGRLDAVAFVTTSYSTGQTVVWVQGREIRLWSRPRRKSVQASLSVDHVMASAALPLFFPAVKVGDAWYGDGGIRMAAPLSPALHLGASRIIAVSTRYDRSAEESERSSIEDYPPPAQVIGILMNAIFLDLIDQDALRLEKMNRLLERLPEEERGGHRIVELMVIRPSSDLGTLAGEFEPRLPKAFRFMTRGLGTRETSSPDALATIMFQPDYLERLIEIGRADAEARADEIAAFLAPVAAGR